MNEKAKNLLKNLNYTVTANFMVLGISVILNLIVPKYLGVKDYGYWQLYVFYSSYVGFFHLGWIDGIYLKIGGAEYEDLDKKSLGTQFYYLFFFQLILSSFLILFSLLFVSDNNKQIVWLGTAIMLIIYNLRSFILFVLQSTNRIKEYAQLSRNDRYLYLIATLLYLLTGGRNFIILILFDIISKLILTIWGTTLLKDIIFLRRIPLVSIYPEIKDNIKIGSNLMLGNIASMLILGSSRFLVEKKWGIEFFGQLSFSLSISNIFIIFISAISIVLYPILRRTNQSNLSNIYVKTRNIFVPLTLGLLLFFYPARLLLEWWLPAYKTSFIYMGVLFPMVVYEGRVSLLVNTYLKTIRKERVILLSNIASLLFSVISSIVSVYIFSNINMVVISIVLSLVIRCIIAELMLSKILKIRLVVENIAEGTVVGAFIISNMLFNSIYNFLIYVVIFSVYYLLYSKQISNSLKYFFSILKTSNT